MDVAQLKLQQVTKTLRAWRWTSGFGVKVCWPYPAQFLGQGPSDVGFVWIRISAP